MREACIGLLAASGRPAAQAADLASGIDALTDGLWLRLYLSTDTMDKEQALRVTGRFLAAAFPEHADRIAARFCSAEARKP